MRAAQSGQGQSAQRFEEDPARTDGYLDLIGHHENRATGRLGGSLPALPILGAGCNLGGNSGLLPSTCMPGLAEREGARGFVYNIDHERYFHEARAFPPHLPHSLFQSLLLIAPRCQSPSELNHVSGRGWLLQPRKMKSASAHQTSHF